MKTKNEIMQEIFDNSAYHTAISKVSPAEKKMIDEVLNGQFAELLFSLHGLAYKVENDPNIKSQFVEALNSKLGVINTEENHEENKT